MRHATCGLLLSALVWLAAGGKDAAAATNFLFAAKTKFNAATQTAVDGRPAIESLDAKSLEPLLLGSLPNAALGILVGEIDCSPLGPRPTVRLVAFDPATREILATLVSFENPAPVFIGQGTVLMHAVGRTGPGLISQQTDALINLQYAPCQPPAPRSRPLGVQLTMLGSLKPFGPPPAFGPLSTDTGTLTVSSDDPDSPELPVALTGRAAPSGICNFTVSPRSLSFGDVQVGTTNLLLVQLSNIGGLACPVFSFSVSGSTDFSLGASAPAPGTVPAGGTLSIPVQYAPSAAGSDSGTLSISSADPAEPTLLVALAGNGVGVPTAQCSLAVTNSLNFGAVEVGDTATLSLSISNRSADVACAVLSVELFGGSDFALATAATNNINLGPQQAVDIPVEFTPLLPGASHASVRVLSTDVAEPLRIVSLTGTGVVSQCRLSVDSLSLAFGRVQIGTNAQLTVTVTNTGPADCAVEAVVVVSAFPDFGVADPAKTNFLVAAGGSEPVGVVFTPTLATNQTGTLQLSTQDPRNRLIQVSLTGQGIDPHCSLVVTNQDTNFGFVAVGFSRTNVVATVMNVGLASGTITNLLVAGSTEFSIIDPVAPVVLAPQQSTNIVVEFVPVDFGEEIAAVRIFDDCPGSLQSVEIRGFGLEPVPDCDIQAPALLDFGTVNVGSTNTLKARISNTGLTNCTVELIRFVPCDGTTDFSTVIPPQPFVLPPNGFADVAVTYRPPAVGSDCGTIEIFGDDADATGPVSVAVTGTAVRCELEFVPASIDFGQVRVGETNQQSVFVSNVSAGDLSCRINSVTRTGSADFRLEPALPSEQLVLGAGDTLEIPVLYIPSNAGEDQGAVRIQSDAGTTNIALTGTGIACRLGVDPGTLDFGTVTVGRTNSLTVTVSNTGSADCAVRLGTNTVGAAFLVLPPAVFVVEPGSNVVVEVRYLPVDARTIVILGGALSSSGEPTVVTEP